MIGTLHKLSSPSCDTSCTELQALLREKFEAYDDCDWLDYSFYVSVYHGSELVGVCEFLIYIDYIFISYIYCNIKRAGVGSSMVKFIMDSYPAFRDYRCYVKKDNNASLSMFSKLGFVVIGDSENDDNFFELRIKRK